MQLTIITFALVFFMFVQDLKAQIFKKVFNGKHQATAIKDSTEIVDETYEKADWKKINIDFLNSYYEQDGNNAAVTGGIGTEQLTDFTQKLKVSFATSQQLKWNIDVAYDYYSSASTNNIDPIRSDDSQSDTRYQLGVGLDYSQSATQQVGFRIGSSVEYDYTSVHAGFHLNKQSLNGNTQFGLYAQAFYDTWQIIYPKEIRRELRRGEGLLNNKRQSYNLALSLGQVISKRMQISLMTEATFMNGLLSTPFHRVYFVDQEQADIERLPTQRLKVPIGLKVNNYISEKLVLRSTYRYYWDSWGMQGHTASIELPYKINRFFAVYPHYRFHTQSSIDHFEPYRVHQSSNEFYTSDFDLSALETHTYGVGILYGKAGGIIGTKIPFTDAKLIIEGIDLKFSHYSRSTGLVGNIISLGFRMSL